MVNLLAAFTTLSILAAPLTSACQYGPQKAIAVLKSDVGYNVTGTVRFYQAAEGKPIMINGTIYGLTPSSLRGFHVHAYGDISTCAAAGPHYNPTNMTHGGPNDTMRHVGDLGNIQSDANGTAVFSINDTRLTLFGDYSIYGRSIVMHTGVDDLGKGGTNVSLTTGNSGNRSACAVIGIAML